jgi:glucose/arabinose dehydrogenase
MNHEDGEGNDECDGVHLRRRFLRAAAATGTAALVAGCVGGPDDGTPTRSETRTGTEAGTATPTDGTTGNESPRGEPHAFLSAPDGFTVETYVDTSDLGGGEFAPGPAPGPRLLAVHDGTLYATVPAQGRAVALPEEGGSVRIETVIEELERPHGIAFDGEDRLYLATAGRVLRYSMDGRVADAATEEVLVDDVPEGRYHWTRTVAVEGPRLYLSAGTCLSGDCGEGNEGYLGTVTAFDLDGSNPTTYATGLRNPVGLTVHDGRLFAPDNGADDLGPELPPDEINVLREGGDYGFPGCYGDNVAVDGNEGGCEGSIAPAVMLPAHCAPLGCGFGTTDALSRGYRGDLYVALHGSWTREDPVGYEVIRVPYDGTLGDPEPFVTGWMPEGGANDDARGRPVDVVASGDGLFVSDDMAGAVYRVRHTA